MFKKILAAAAVLTCCLGNAPAADAGLADQYAQNEQSRQSAITSCNIVHQFAEYGRSPSRRNYDRVTVNSAGDIIGTSARFDGTECEQWTIGSLASTDPTLEYAIEGTAIVQYHDLGDDIITRRVIADRTWLK